MPAVGAARSLLALALVLGGCGNCRGPATSAPGSGGAPATGAEPITSGTGVLVGTVRLAEGAELPLGPEWPELPPAWRADCPAPTAADREELHLGAARGLGGVLVSVTGFSRQVASTPTEHRVAIDRCRLTPSLVAATKGDSLRLANRTKFPFIPVLGRDALMRAVLEGQERVWPLETPGLHSLGCELVGPCRKTLVVVQHHPLHAITGPDGRFRIENIPVGEPLSVHAWHPLLRETAANAGALGPGRETTVELALSPAPAAPAGTPAPAAPAGGAGGHPEDSTDVLF